MARALPLGLMAVVAAVVFGVALMPVVQAVSPAPAPAPTSDGECSFSYFGIISHVCHPIFFS